ncbi:MAG: OmpW/AlkL family protein [Gammaproteobacteria bacterium]
MNALRTVSPSRFAPAVLAPVVVAVLAAAALPAAAADSPWTVRFRALHIDTANKSAAIPALAVPKDAIAVSSKWAPDIDIEYAFNEQLSTELLLTIPQRHDVTVQQSALGGPVGIGSFKHLPPTLTLKYRPLGNARLSPYLGAGINYTRIWDVRLAVPTVGSLRLDRDSFGLAVQAGADYRMDDHWHLSVDVKYVKLDSAIQLGATRVSRAGVDPLLLGIGAGYRF